MEGQNESHKTVDHPTIFHELLRSDLPPEELTPDRLFQEAQSIIGGGVLTTAWALTVAGFHIIDKPEIFRRLRAELEEAIPNPDRIAELDWLKLEQLPYLSAVIREGVRLAYGVTARSPRLSPKALQYKEWTIPARTPVSMSMVDLVSSVSNIQSVLTTRLLRTMYPIFFHGISESGQPLSPFQTSSLHQPLIHFQQIPFFKN